MKRENLEMARGSGNVFRDLGYADADAAHVNFSAENNHMVANSILARAKSDGSWELVENFGQVQPNIPGCKLT